VGGPPTARGGRRGPAAPASVAMVQPLKERITPRPSDRRCVGYATLDTGAGVFGPDDGFEDESSLYYRWKQGEFTVVPEGNHLLDIWDITVISALFATAVVLPFDVAIFPEPPFAFRALEAALDLIFIADIVITFNVAYSVMSMTNRDMFERAPLKIVRHYMAFPFSDNCTAGWFWPDVLTVIPWNVVYHAEGIRLVRILRLARMFRLIRIIRLLKKWHTHFGFPISLLNVFRCLGCTMMMCHWFACMWGHLAVAEEAGDKNWLQAWLELHKNGKRVSDCTALEVYNIALYWSCTTLTSVGFGDVEPQNQLEVTLTSVTMLLLGILWAWVLAHFVNVITNIDQFATEARQLMDDLNLLMEHRHLNPALRHRLRKHLYESFNVHRQRHQQRTVKWLSAGLQGELAVQSGVDQACDCIWYMRNLEQEVIIAIAQRFVGDMFSPNEYIRDRYSVSVIRRGTSLRRTKLLTRDDVIGEDMILATEHLVDTVCPRTVTFVEVMSLSRNDLLSVCESHQGFDQRVRKAQVRLAVRRAVVYEANLRKRGKSYLMLASPQCRMHVQMHRPGFAQSMSTMRGFRGISVQESLTEVIQELEALRRRVDDTQAVCVAHCQTLHTKLEQKLEERGEAAAERKRSFGLTFCSRSAG